MATYDEVKDFIVTTDANTNKNLSSGDFSYSSPAVSVGVGSYVLRSYTVPLSRDTRFYQLYVRLSIDSDSWTALPTGDRLYNSNQRAIAINTSSSGSNTTLSLYLVNQSGSTQSFPAFTVFVTRRDFVDEA